MKVVTLGIDMSSQPAGTAACAITWEAGRAVAATPCLSCDDGRLTELIADSGAVGIDAPFGWPADFTAAVAVWNHIEWNNDLRDRLRFRAADRLVRAVTGRWPLSVSSDLIPLPAMRTSALLLRYGVTNRSGDGKFFVRTRPASAGHRDSHQEAWGNFSRLISRFSSPTWRAAPPPSSPATLRKLCVSFAPAC
jgi:hypothetical protein